MALAVATKVNDEVITSSPGPTPSASNGQIVVARLDDEVTVKRYFRHPHGIELRAENPDYQPIWVEPNQAIAIEGLAVGLIRPDTL